MDYIYPQIENKLPSIAQHLVCRPFVSLPAAGNIHQGLKCRWLASLFSIIFVVTLLGSEMWRPCGVIPCIYSLLAGCRCSIREELHYFSSKTDIINENK